MSASDDDLAARLAEQGDQPEPLFPVDVATDTAPHARQGQAVATDSLGPNVVDQVFFASTLYGRVARCGCGWRAVHVTDAAALASGRRHAWAVHAVLLSTLLGDDGAA